MKKYFLFPFLLTMVVAFFSGCKEKEGVVNLTLIAPDDLGTKSHLYNQYVAWDNGDQVNINGEVYTVEVNSSTRIAQIAYVPTTSGNHYRAIFPASIATNNSVNGYGGIVLPITQVYHPSKIDIPMVAINTPPDAALNFEAITSLMEITVSGNIIVRSIKVSTDGALLCGNGTVRSDAESHPYVNLASGQSYVTLDCGESGVSVSGNRTFYVVIPPVNNAKFTITILARESGTGEYVSYSRTQSGTSSIVRSMIGKVPFDLSGATKEYIELPGLFSVSSTKKVRFSKGNLQYSGTSYSPIWNFASHQYDVIYSSNGNRASGTIDVFGWACNGVNNGQEAYSSRSNSSDVDKYYYVGNISSNYSCDWGSNPIENAVGLTGWRTLTQDEWYYLFYQRGYSTSRKGLATVNGWPGLVLLPDDPWTLPSGLTWNKYENANNTFSSNVYSLEDWQKMEAAGAVFLPVSGYCYGGNHSANNAGLYWSSTSAVTTAKEAYTVYFTDASLQATSKQFISRGQAVRLVRDFTN